MAFIATPDHEAFFDNLSRYRVPSGEPNHIVFDAVAGSGKTTSLLEGIKSCPTDWPFLYMSFSRKCITDVQPKLGDLNGYRVEAKTFHGVMWAALKFHIGWKATSKSPESDKLRRLVQEEIPNRRERKLIGPPLEKLVGMSKQVGICPTRGVERKVYPLLVDTGENFAALIEQYQIEVPSKVELSKLYTLARRILRRSINELGTVDFDDMIWAPVMLKVKPKRYRVVMVDEAQDLNPVQRAGCHLFAERGARMVFVGDPFQSIYGFRGADTESFSNIKKEFEPACYSLPKSYRCPQAVGPLVRPLVPHFEVADGNIPGEVRDRGEVNKSVIDELRGADDNLILCRNNAPLVKLAFALFRARVRCQVLGRDIGASLLSLIDRMKATNLPDLAKRLLDYQQQQTAILREEDREHLIEPLNDKVETLRVFIGEAENIESLPGDIERVLLPPRGRDDVEEVKMLTLCTVHKAKGAEAPTVWILNRNLFAESEDRAEASGDPEQVQQERNIQYVAYTRTLKRMFYIYV